MKIGICGTLESNDCLITVRRSDKLSIRIESIVYDFFGEQIESVIRETIAELGIDNLEILCEDKGALDYAIKARLMTSIKRLEE